MEHLVAIIYLFRIICHAWKVQTLTFWVARQLYQLVPELWYRDREKKNKLDDNYNTKVWTTTNF